MRPRSLGMFLGVVPLSSLSSSYILQKTLSHANQWVSSFVVADHSRWHLFFRRGGRRCHLWRLASRKLYASVSETFLTGVHGISLRTPDLKGIG